MTMDRELRSSKRQRVGAAGVDVSVVQLESQEQVTDMQMDSANKGQNDDRKIPESSEENKRHMNGNQIDAINVRASSKTRRSKGHNDGSSDLFPEHNEKLASTLLSLKETDIPAPQCESFPKAGNRRSLDSDASVATENCLFAETCNERSYDIQEMEQIETQLLLKLKKYIDANGGPPIGDGWKVQVTKGNKVMYKVYFSPDGKRFRSMREIARSVGITPKKKRLSGVEENLDKTKLEVDDARGSICLKTDVAQMQEKTEKLEVYQIHRGRVKKAKRSRRHQEVLAPQVAVEDRIKQARLLHDAEIHPLSGLSTSELKEKNMPDIAKSSSPKKREYIHWSELLEMVLKSSNMTENEIRNQILKSLASEPPEWVKQKLQSSIATDVHDRSGVGQLKDVILAVLAEYKGKEVNCMDPVKETFYEKSVDVQETGMPNEEMVQTEFRTKNFCQKTSPSFEVVTEHCRNVFQDVTSADKFAQLCNLIHGNFAGSRTHEVFDFHLIDLRMNAGTYGMSPALFDSDMQQIWKKVREVGEEMVHLADNLADYSRASYKKQVTTLLEGETDLNPQIDHINVAMRACNNEAGTEKDTERPRETIGRSQRSKRNSKMTQILRVESGQSSRISRKKVNNSKNKIVGGVEVKDTLGNAHPSSKETASAQNMEVHMNGHLEHKQDGLPNGEVSSSGNQVQCTSCGSNEHHERIIFCGKCQAAYHIYCLSPALETIPSTSWYCSCCSAVGKNSSEVLCLYDGKDRMAKEDMNSVVHSLVSEMHDGLLEMQNVQEDGKVDTHNEKVQIENNMKDSGAHADSKVIGIEMDREDICSHMNQSDTTLHASKQESELHCDKGLIANVCKLCTTGTRDDDHLIQCSNENCLYKFYHLRCLRPPLASVPPPSWYCPSCLCRSCFMDENDACIVLCDGCDDAYHTYCLKPPLEEIPENNWYCPSCLDKQKKKKGKRVLNSTAVKSTGRVRSKKASQAQNLSALQLDKKGNLSEITVGSAGHFRSKNSSKLSSPSYIQRGVHDISDKIVKCEIEGFVQHEQSHKASQMTNYPPEEAGEAVSDGSLDVATEKFIVRVRPRHTPKYKTGSELKDAAKRKRKCAEPRRSEV